MFLSFYLLFQFIGSKKEGTRVSYVISVMEEEKN